MVDRYAKAWVRLRDKQLRSKLSDWQASRLDATLARTYTDDMDIVGGAMSAPRRKDRPGQRDDSVSYGSTGLMPVL
jgi:hypothetical protein